MAHNLLFIQIIARISSFFMRATVVKRDEPWWALPPIQLLIHTEFAQILTQCYQHDSDREDSAAVTAANII